jgi:hypothetical protein
MTKCIVELYCIVLDRDTQKYQTLSKHSEKFIVLSDEIKEDTNSLNFILSKLIENYISISSDYIKFIHLEPRIENKNVILSYFCWIPYNIELKNCYKLYTEDLVNDHPLLRKITNVA